MTMRDDVRTAFEREQSALGDVGDARHRLVHAAMVNRDLPTSRGLQWAAGVAAVLIAAIVITTFALVKAGSHANTLPAAAPSPRAQASPTPLTNALNVPDSTPILVYLDPANPQQVDGMTWDGKLSGRIVGGSVATGNPANSMFGDGNQIVDRHGTVVATGTFGGKFWQATWADDETHFCLISPFDNPGSAGIPTTLEIGAPGQSPKSIAQVGTLYNQTGVTVLACSVLGDRAVVAQSGGQGIGVAQYWVVQLSTGRVLWTHSFRTGTSPSTVVVSRDGELVAEVNQDLSGTPSNSTIFGSNGSVVKLVPGAVREFSWDGTLVVTSLANQVVQVIHWLDLRIVWTGPQDSNAYYIDGFAEPDPGGTSVAIMIHNQAYGGEGPDATGLLPGDLYVIGLGGKVISRIAHAYL